VRAAVATVTDESSQLSFDFRPISNHLRAGTTLTPSSRRPSATTQKRDQTVGEGRRREGGRNRPAAALRLMLMADCAVPNTGEPTSHHTHHATRRRGGGRRAAARRARAARPPGAAAARRGGGQHRRGARRGGGGRGNTVFSRAASLGGGIAAADCLLRKQPSTHPAKTHRTKPHPPPRSRPSTRAACAASRRSWRRRRARTWSCG
jgi:hypothetical protein